MISLKSIRLFPEDIFRSDHLRKDLAAKSVRGSFTTVSTRVFRFILDMVRLIVLARLLTPEDFNLVGMVAVIINS